MLNNGSPRRAVTQAPTKLTVCHAGCGATVEFRTNPKVICAACKPMWRRAQSRASAEKQRRKRGVPEIKGTVIACARCNVPVTLNRSARAKFCEACAIETSRYRARERVRAACIERRAPKIGAAAHCRACKAVFIRTGARNYLCGECGEKSRNMVLNEGQRAKARSYKRNWELENKPKLRLYQKASRTRRKVDPAFGINERMSAGVRYSLESGKMGSSWEALVGYSLSELMTHLERQFLPGMSWEKRSEWHIDHRRPLCSFEFRTPDCPQFREAWAITNLQPLWAADNIRKSGRRDLLL